MTIDLVVGVAELIVLAGVLIAIGMYKSKFDLLWKKCDKCDIVVLTSRIDNVEKTLDTFWKTIDEIAPRQIIYPHTPTRDALLRKMTNHELTLGETSHLLLDLQESIGTFPQEYKMTVVLLIARLRILEAELGVKNA